MRKLFLFFAAGAFFASCTTDKFDEGVAPEPQPQQSSEAKNPYTISADEALDNMFEMMDRIYGPATRASARATVSVETIKSGGRRTRSGAAPSVNLAYVANFGNDQGYAIMGAHAGLPPVLALTESGNIDAAAFQEAVETGVVPEAGFAVRPPIGPPVPPAVPLPIHWKLINILRCTPVYWEGHLVEGELDCEVIETYFGSMGGGGGGGTPDINNPPGEAQLKSRTYTPVELWKVGPFVRTKWTQSAPFNDNCPERGGKRAPAGCGAIAVAQMLAANGKPNRPSKIDDRITSTWDELVGYNPATVGNPNKSDYQKRIEGDLAKLVHKIGKNIKMSYGKNGSSTTPHAVEPYLNVTLGYGWDGGVVGYDWHKIMKMLDDGLPVYTRGFEKNLSDGHAWLIDGVASYAQMVEERWEGWTISNGAWSWKSWTDNYVVGEHTLLHCNWGWSGLSDGYYNDRLFNTGAGPVHREGGVDTTTDTNGTSQNDNLLIIKYKW